MWHSKEIWIARAVYDENHAGVDTLDCAVHLCVQGSVIIGFHDKKRFN